MTRDPGLWEISLRVGLCLLAAALIGIEREIDLHPAGLRTHLLVSLGACGFTLGGLMFDVADPTRLAASVTTGIGFLGAGVILRDQLHVKGVTTAASLWISAALGVLAGLGAYVAGLIVTVAALLVLIVARSVEPLVRRGRALQALVIDIAPNTDLAALRMAVESVVGPFDISGVYPQAQPTSGAAALSAQSSGPRSPGMQLIGEVRMGADPDVVAVATRLGSLTGVTGVRLTR